MTDYRLIGDDANKNDYPIPTQRLFSVEKQQWADFPLSPIVDPATEALIDVVTSQPQLLPAANADIEGAFVPAGESKTLSASGVRGYRLILHAAIATGAVTVTDSGGTYTLPVGCIGLFEFQTSGDVTINNASNTGGPVTVLEVA